MGTAAAPGALTPPPKKGTISLFGAPKKPAAAAPEVPEINKELAGMSRRLRILEERFENLKKKVALVENNMLETNKKVITEVKTSVSDIMDVKGDVSDMQSKMLLLIKEINLLAKKEDVDLIKKYMEYWKPLNFITQNQVEKIVNEILDERLHE